MFKTELQSAEQDAGGVARLCCQLSDSEAGAPVLWLKEGVELHRSPKYEMRRQGATCELLIHGLEAKDVGEYSCTAGSQKTLAFLKVKGERPLPHPPPAQLPRGHAGSLSPPPAAVPGWLPGLWGTGFLCSPLRCSGLVCLQESVAPLTALPSTPPCLQVGQLSLSPCLS